MSVDNKTATSKRESHIIFDWDDTLLSSSYLSGKGYRLDSHLVRGDGSDLDIELGKLEQAVIVLLNTALQYGAVHIITNAETGWVQLSAAKFIPAVVPLLSQLNICSARSTYEHMFPDSPLKWKYHAMQERLYSLYNGATCDHNIEKHILSFGDSHVEREAVRAVTRGLTNTLTKSVKFAERPSMEQLRRQVELVNNCFTYINNHTGDLDLQLTVTLNTQQPINNASAPKQVSTTSLDNNTAIVA